ncbi:hypothetical protein, partial [Streptomyces sp. NPDC001880]
MLTITHRTGDYYGDGSSNLIWETRDEDSQLIAELYVSTDRHEIMNIWVDDDHRGEGHARRLYETATAQTDVFHAPVGHRTEEVDVLPGLKSRDSGLGRPTLPGASCFTALRGHG